jgi:hypothetical protein
MMPNKRLVAVAGAAALVLVGCSSPKVTIRPPTSAATSTAVAQSTESSSEPPADDPSYMKFNDALDKWVHQVCPT